MDYTMFKRKNLNLSVWLRKRLCAKLVFYLNSLADVARFCTICLHPFGPDILAISSCGPCCTSCRVLILAGTGGFSQRS